MTLTGTWIKFDAPQWLRDMRATTLAERGEQIRAMLKRLAKLNPAFGEFDVKLSLTTDRLAARFSNWLARPTSEQGGFVAAGSLSFVVFPIKRLRGGVISVGRMDGHRFRFAASPGRMRAMAEELTRAAQMLKDQARADFLAQTQPAMTAPEAVQTAKAVASGLKALAATATRAPRKPRSASAPKRPAKKAARKVAKKGARK